MSTSQPQGQDGRPAIDEGLMHYLEVAFIFLAGFAMLLVGLFMILRFCDRRIARAARRLARHKKTWLIPESDPRWKA